MAAGEQDKARVKPEPNPMESSKWPHSDLRSWNWVVVQIIYEQSAHTGITNADDGRNRIGQDTTGRDGTEQDKEAQTSVVIVLQLLYYNSELGTRNWGQSAVVAQ